MVTILGKYYGLETKRIDIDHYEYIDNINDIVNELVKLPNLEELYCQL